MDMVERWDAAGFRLDSQKDRLEDLERRMMIQEKRKMQIV